jgi:small subunit ribosomal protein S14
MAKTSVIARNEKRDRMIKKYAERREALKKVVKDESVAPEERLEAMHKLAELPRNSSKVRHRNRCFLTGRGRGMLSRFGLCRNEFRRLAHMGQIVGVTKSSW